MGCTFSESSVKKETTTCVLHPGLPLKARVPFLNVLLSPSNIIPENTSTILAKDKALVLLTIFHR